MNNNALAELEREFAVSQTMTAAIYATRRAAILARAPDPVPAPDAANFVSPARLHSTLVRMATNIARGVAPIAARLSKLEKKVHDLAEIPGALQIASTINNLEKTLRAPTVAVFNEHGKVIGAKRASGALSDAAPVHDADVTTIELRAQLAKAGTMIESLERRCSRHADHLSRIENRLKKLEHQ